MEPTAASYPVSFAFESPEHIARWRPLVAWLLIIPHAIILYAVQIAASVCILISWFAILFTGKQPGGLAGFPMLLLRYQNRVATYSMFMQEEYPPFTYPTEGPDPADYPHLRVDVTPAIEGRNRLTVFFRPLMLIPQYLVLLFVGIAAGIVIFIAWFAVIITGKWPEGLRTFMVGYLRWTTRVNGYAFLLTDEYPPFAMD